MVQMMDKVNICFLFFLTVTGCGTGSDVDTGTEAGVVDTGTEPGVVDTGTEPGVVDTGTEAGIVDTGTEAGVVDTGTEPGVVDTDTESVTFTIGDTEVYVVDKDRTYATKTLGPVNGQDARSGFGGDLTRNVGGTGFFRTTQVNGNWYFVDPDGYLYISVGLNSVDEGGGIALPEDLQSIGFNSLGNWSNYSAVNSGEKKIPYTTKYSFLSGFVKDDSYDGGTTYLEDLFTAGVLPVVFSDFDQFCTTFAAQAAALKDDPWVIGIFSDNELPFYDGSGKYGDVLDRWLALDQQDKYYQYAISWLAGRGKEPSSVDADDKADYAAHIVSVYYQKVSSAIKAVDPNHLYIGSRFHGGAKSQSNLFAAAGPYVDVFSVNYYGSWTPDWDNMEMWLGVGKKPFLISEFYVKGADSGLGNADGAGWEVTTQTDRGLFYTNWLLALYAHPGAIGSHWFRYIDKAGQDSNKGFVSESYDWYEPLKDAAANTNARIYQLVSFLRGE